MTRTARTADVAPALPGDAEAAPAAVQASADADFGRGEIAPRHAYEGASRRGTFLGGWRANLRSADLDFLPDRDQLVAKARDVGRNDVLGQSATARRINSAVGFGWRLMSKPDHRALGISYEAAAELGAQIETEFKLYAYGHAFESDAERQLTFGQLLRCTAAHIFIDGEAVGLTEWAEDEGTRYSTRLRLVDPDRLSNPNGQPDSPTLRAGVEKTRGGVPVRYWIREGHPADIGAIQSLTWTPWDRWTDWGRPVVLHAYDKLRAGQSRGITRFAAALKAFRSLGKFSDATLEAATLNALFVAFVKSNAGPAAVKENFTADDMSEFDSERREHYEDHPVNLNGAQVGVLPFGDELVTPTPDRQTAGFDAFVRSVIRLIAAALGVTYEELSMDYSQTNYSSARAAMVHAWAETLALRGLIEAQVVRPFFVAWLEEAFDKGYVQIPAGAPDFYAAIDAYAASRWIGPARGYIDPTKEIDAAAARIEAGISTLEDECAEQGKDYRDVIPQQAHEQQLREDNGLRPYGPALYETGQDARDPLRDKALEEKPDSGPASARVRRTARSPEHEAVLERRTA